MTPISVEKIAKQYDKFVCYPHKGSLENNRHPKDPNAYRKADLKEVRKINILVLSFIAHLNSHLKIIPYMLISLGQLWTGNI